MKLLPLAVLLVGLSTPAFAQGQGGAMRTPPDPDANKDGKVTLDELKAVEARGMISQLDADKDGMITRAEFKPLVDFAAQRGGEAGAKRTAGLFLVLDADKDGKITRAERDAATERRFKMVDSNHDGWLSKGEVLQTGQMRQRAN